ncbi:amidohydrolase family protein [Phenylobacterium sp. LH3H17]|uniref:N-acyl-D-amino-acid deacylase family protein n=1 Tax=Phenylobacterium sp. LH3H17 TaxID=2903901 RepID=UPI0020CA1B06|nr:amidohydrolase family protein [Phenylobacterium sp. LH3H17]UTP38298.1 amidohydrolase family protein [Phenylobacterium sp. LH3H17]
MAGASGAVAAYDQVIRNGRVLDGAGNPWVAADIAIQDGRIAKVGRIEAVGIREIDATGLYVAPGFIDMMDQSGKILMEHGLAPNKTAMGVTTVIAGELGTPVPAPQVSDFLDGLERRGVAVNFGTYFSATHARREVMGDGSGRPSADEMARMCEIIATAMQQGCFGITTALVYAPAAFQDTDELVELARAAGAYGGIYASHVRDEAQGLVGAIEEAITIGERAGVQVEIFHLKAAYRPGAGTLIAEVGRVIEAARARGVSIAANMYPYVAAATGLEVTAPTWLFADGKQTALERLRSPAVRDELKLAVEAGATDDWSNFVEASGGWDNVVLANAYNPEYDRFRFRSLSTIARELRQHPADVAWDIVLAAQPNRALALYFMMDESDVVSALRFPWTSIGSDAAAAAVLGGTDGLGLPHPRSYGTFPRIIAEYVRRRQVLSLPEAVRKMTSWPAMRMGLDDRGLIKAGLYADIVVFDLDKIDDCASWESPTAAAVGIEHVLVNGQAVVSDGRPTAATPGIALRGPGSRRRPPGAAPVD